jgi:hypothetical protein
VRRRPSWPVALGTGFVAVLLVVGILSLARGPAATGGQAMTEAPEEPPPSLAAPPAVEDWPRWGITHTQYSAEHADQEIREAAAHVIERVPMVQNQHIMGFGAGNPEPAPGKYDFRALDDRMKFISQSKGIPVLTLCCAPDWMKGGAEGRTNWDQQFFEAAPKREHFDDYAALAVKVAKRYKQVKHFLVWNEFKGFWHPTASRWDYEAYTELYNKVYDALKAVDPEIQVGGPYAPIGSHIQGDRSELQGDWGIADQRVLDAVKYWIANKKGADFIVIDGASVSQDERTIPDEFGALRKFGAVTEWIRRQAGDLPVWWSEWYVEPASSDWTEERRTAVLAASMIEFARSRVTTALYWNPQQKAGTDAECPGCLWRPRDGSELPMAGVLSGFAKWFPAHAAIDTSVTASDPRVWVLAQERQMVMVNTGDAPVTAVVDGVSFELAAHEIKWSPRGGGT